MKQRNDFTDHIESFLAEHGISTYRFEKRKRGHRSVVIQYGGREHTIFFPCTCNDWRGPKMTVSTIRHVLGLVGKPANGNSKMEKSA